MSKLSKDAEKGRERERRNVMMTRLVQVCFVLKKKHDDDVFEEVIIVSRVSSALMRVFHQRE